MYVINTLSDILIVKAPTKMGEHEEVTDDGMMKESHLDIEQSCA